MQDHSAENDRLARRKMVAEQISSRGIHDPRVLAAMEEVPRERFVPADIREQAFADRALPIDCGQTISQPFIVACMTAYLEIQPQHRVLEIGTGSGYQTAILARLAGQVYTVERIETLLTTARNVLDSIGLANVYYRVGDGSLGWPEFAPYDRIIVTAAAPRVPPALIDQLADQGRLVIPVGSEREQTLTLVKREHGRVIETPRIPVRFVKLIGGQAWSQDIGQAQEDET